MTSRTVIDWDRVSRMLERLPVTSLGDVVTGQDTEEKRDNLYVAAALDHLRRRELAQHPRDFESLDIVDAIEAVARTGKQWKSRHQFCAAVAEVLGPGRRSGEKASATTIDRAIERMGDSLAPPKKTRKSRAH